MAKLLSTHDSALRCMNMARRHERLTKQVVNDNKLISAVKQARENLAQKVKLRDEKQTAREDAYDDQSLCDRNLDDSVRTSYEKCEQYDRENPSETILKKVFPDEKFGEIVRLPLLKEVTMVDKITVRIESLGNSHSLYSLATDLKKNTVATSEAIKKNEDAIKAVKMAEAEVEITKEALIRLYESNYLDARRTYGKSTCEKLFPKVQTQTETAGEEENIAEAAVQQ